ncbi:MAG: hypothetical protein RBU45_18530 [Myxococcota bacterium]|nr:hypothetical protein [Myxococcota bacterium]
MSIPGPRPATWLQAILLVALGSGGCAKSIAPPPPECEPECAESGLRACFGAGYRLCAEGAVPGCLVWSAVLPCGEGEGCAAGRCQPLPCEDRCPADGQRECLIDGWRRCADLDDDGCLEWSEPVPCAALESCSGGQCRAVCEDDCAPGERICDGNGYRTCGEFDSDGCRDWSSVVGCGAAARCEQGDCQPECVPECAAAEARCTEAGQVQVCDTSPEAVCPRWGKPADCPAAQTCPLGESACQPICQHDCEVDATRCPDATSWQYCSTDERGCRQWSPAEPCAELETCKPATGRCSPPVCESECADQDVRCSEDGLGLQRCEDPASDGCWRWSLPTPCGEGQRCEQDHCVLDCTPGCPTLGQTRCNGSQQQTCVLLDSGCLGWGPLARCPAGQSCSDGSCREQCVDECSPTGDVRCAAASNSLQSCGDWDDDPCLEWSLGTPCPAGQTCSGESCQLDCQDDCQAGARRCVLEGLQDCGQYDADLCLDWSPATHCGADEVCEVDRCVVSCQDECLAGETTCLDDAHLARCGNHDADRCLEWEVAPAACPDGGFCNDSRCFSTTPPGPVRISELLYNDDGTDGEQVFVELFGPPGTPLEGYSLEGINGANGEVYNVLPLSGTIPARGHYLIVHPKAEPDLLAAADLVDTRADYQNENESLQLLWGGRVVADALGYGFGSDLTHFQGEGSSAPAAAPGSSLTRDEAATDSDNNRWDFSPTSSPSPGGPFVPPLAEVTVQAPDAAPQSARFPRLVSLEPGLLAGAFAREDGTGLLFGLGDEQGGWALEPVAPLPTLCDQRPLGYRSPLGMHPHGDFAVAFVASVTVSAGITGGQSLRGVKVGYAEYVAAPRHEWVVSWLSEVPADSYTSSQGSWVDPQEGAGLALDEAGRVAVAWVVEQRLPEPRRSVHVKRREAGGGWTLLPIIEDIVGPFALLGGPRGLRLVTTTVAAPGIRQVRLHALHDGVWGAPVGLAANLQEPLLLRGKVDAAGWATVCYLDLLAQELAADGALVAGRSSLTCLTEQEASWTATEAVGAGDALVPIEFDLDLGPTGPVLAVRDLSTHNLRLVAAQANDRWSTTRIDFGGRTGLTPAVACNPVGKTLFLFRREGSRSGLVFAYPPTP